MMAEKMQRVPTALPTNVPDLTDAARNYFIAHKTKGFYEKYGTHFVVGFQQGGYLSFSYQLEANEFIDKAELSAMFSLSFAIVEVEVGGGFKVDKRGKTVNIQKSVKSNTNLPPIECARAAISENFDATAASYCVKAWFDQPGYAAYNAYAVPYIFHPDFQALVAEHDPGYIGSQSGRKLLAITNDPPVADYRFKATGILQFRLNLIKKSLEKYQFKEDLFFYKAQKAVEAAQAAIDTTFTFLRAFNSTSIDDWQPYYNKALGLLNVASARSDNTPKGEKGMGSSLGGC